MSTNPWGRPESTVNRPSQHAAYPSESPEDYQARRLSESHQQRRSVKVTLGSLDGGWLKFSVYTVSIDQLNLSKRYSDFDFLNEYLLRVYAFRLIPPLPPKRLAINGRHLSDDQFLERRARGLARFTTALVNHPVLSKDPIVERFLSDHSSIEHVKALAVEKLDEASSTTLSPEDEMLIPQDFDIRLQYLRDNIISLVDHWTKICQAYERSIKKQETIALDYQRMHSLMTNVVETERSNPSLSSQLRSTQDHLETAAHHFTTQADLLNHHANVCRTESLENFKAHRELASSFRDLLVRHQKISPDAIERLRKNAANNMRKIEAGRAEQKPNWSTLEPKLISLIEADNDQIEALLKRRVFIRSCLWAEIQHLFQSATLLSSTLGTLAQAETHHAAKLQQDWAKLESALHQ